MQRDNPDQHTIYEEAGEWLSKMAEGPLDTLSRRRFVKWLEADPQHQATFEAMLNTWQTPGLENAFNKLKSPVKYQTCAFIKKQPPMRLWAGSLAATIVVVISLVWLLPAVTFVNPKPLVLTADVKQRGEHTLSDGSALQLQPASQLTVDFSDAERRINLRQGQAYFSVAKDKQRPFIVKVGMASITAVGTAFNIDRGQHFTDVTVYEGTVEVRGEISQKPILLTAGERVRVAGKHLGKITQVNLSRIIDWRSGWIEIDNEPLSYLIERLNRYSATPIVLNSATIGEQRIAGRFRLRDTDQALAVISQLHRLDVEYSGNVIRLTR